jgi:hypothetical protein
MPRPTPGGVPVVIGDVRECILLRDVARAGADEDAELHFQSGSHLMRALKSNVNDG